MKNCFGYKRVSTVKQGEKGVSLQEQHDAIVRFAERNGITVTEWFEERETAAKRGRPVFDRILALLKSGKAHGVVIHKIDRSARNLKDWADLGELIDQGIEVHFANEGLDLHSRGGRLSADIQAVVAADFIRNLREETRKGFYGRIKQGFYPLPAPIGYLDRGKAKFKELDPIRAPLIRKAFELYATARFNLESLSDELYRVGLRNRGGEQVGIASLSVLLNNPFYYGLIRLSRTGETFRGGHKPIITKSDFDRVQVVLKGKFNARTQRHAFMFRRLISCAKCTYSLYGERQKGHVYYRCHTKDCSTKGVREEALSGAIQTILRSLKFSEDEKQYFKARISKLTDDWEDHRHEEIKTVDLQLNAIQERMNRLTDAYIDRMIDKEAFENRKGALLHEEKRLEEHRASLNVDKNSLHNRLEQFLELAGNAWLSYEMGLPEEKRELIRMITSNRELDGHRLYFKPQIWFAEIANRSNNTNGAPYRDTPRTMDALINKLITMFENNVIPQFPCVRPVTGHDSTALAA